MTSKERMMRALNKEKPDRLPVTVHQWQGYHLQEHMGGVSALEAFQQVGLDAQIQYFADMGQFWLPDADYTKSSTPEWRDEVRVVSRDPDNRIALIGGMDQHNVLTAGTPAQIRKQVRRLFEKVGSDGGYILSCADHFFETPPKKLKVFAQAAKECTY